MKKPVRKAVPKRRGYASGGVVTDDEKQAPYAGIDAALSRAPQTKETADRYEAAHDAIASSVYNDPSTGAGRKAVYRAKLADKGIAPGKMETGRSIELGRADYPGFAKGGKVKKFIRKRK